MIAALAALALAAAPPAQLSVSRGGWTVTLDGSEIANLAYQLDCLSGVAPHCSKDAFQALWKEKLGWTAEDDASLRRWKALHQPYAHTFALEPSAEGDPFPTTPALMDFAENLRVVFLQARTRAQLDHDLRLLVAPADADAMLAELDRFTPRFHPWFQQTGRPQVQAFARGFVRLLQDRGLIDYVGQVARFYGVPAGPHAIHVHLVAHPLAKAHTYGQQLEGHAVVECLQGEDPARRIDVVLHEAFHFMYRAGAGEKALEAGFLASPDPRALSAYGLLDEVLATALGNALVPKRLLPAAEYAQLMAHPRRLYDDPFIAPVAQAAVPLVEERLAHGPPLDGAFAAQFIAAARKALGPRLDSPVLALRTMALAWDGDALEPAAKALERAVSPRSMWRSSPLAERDSVAQLADHARLDGAVLVLASQLQDLKGWSGVLGADALPALEARARRESAFVHAVARPTGAKVWILVARDPPAMQRLVANFVTVDPTATPPAH